MSTVGAGEIPENPGRGRVGAGESRVLAIILRQTPNSSRCPLDAVDHYRDDPEYGYLFHHWVVSCQLVGPVDPEKFELALHDVAVASPVLRSFFKKEGQAWQHMIAPSLDAPFFSYKKHDTGTDWRSVVGALTHQLNDQILPVWQTPIFKVLLQEFDDITVATFHIHHLMLDGWGLIVFFQQLVHAYEARLTDQPSPLAILDEDKFLQIYRAHAKTRNLSWVMRLKLSDTWSRNVLHSLGMVSRMNTRTASANCF